MPDHNDHKLTHLKIDKTAADVRRLHPLLQLINVGENDMSDGVASALINLLTSLDTQLDDQARIMAQMKEEMSILRRQVQGVQDDMAFLIGYPDEEGTG